MTLMHAHEMIGLTIGLAFMVVATQDARTGRVKVLHAKLVTGYCLAATLTAAILNRSGTRLVTAALGAAMVTLIQLVPYLIQHRQGRPLIGKADVRLAVPYGWTLGWLGIGYVYVGFAVTLISALMWAGLMRSQRVRFVPFMSLGLWAACAWSIFGVTG